MQEVVIQSPGPIRSPLTTIVHGHDSLDELPDIAEGFGARRVLILAGPRAAAGRTYARAADLLGARLVATFEAIEPHTPVSVVSAVAALAREKQVDAIVAIGGGSTSDTAKAVSTLIAERRPLEELTTYFEPPDRYVERWLREPKMPVITVPGTLSGAESGPRFGFTGPDGIKRICGGDFVATRALILDPVATLDTDPDVFLRSGMNGLAHAVEGLYSKRRSPISDAAGLEAARLFFEYLPRVRKDPTDLQSRMQLLYANYLGSVVLASARICIHHALCHVLGARAGLAHSDANAVVLPHAMSFNRDFSSGPLARLGRTLGLDDGDGDDAALADAVVRRVFELQDEIGAPSQLSQLASWEASIDLDRIAQDAMIERGVFFNPRPVRSAEDVLELVRAVV